MFNLGYLPRGDQAITTEPSSTVSALEQVMKRLRAGGIVTVLVYRGHEGGIEEAKAVESWLQSLDGCTVERFNSYPPRPTSPVLFVLIKEE